MAASFDDPAGYASERRRKKGDASPNKSVTQASSSPIEERAVLVGIGPTGNLQIPDMKLDELGRLARTAGADVVGRLYQNRPKPFTGTYLGSGKLIELKQFCEECEATLVVADDDLTPAQVRNMEEVIDLRVIDRSELIIHIFVMHAGTRQARLQVELAQLKYLSPRLKRMWTHLSRITGAGGIGSRGPGEKQIEVDRRIIQKRLRDLRSELDIIEGRRERQVHSRDNAAMVALVGYTNAGKSTLMNALTGADVFVADQLFATLETRTRRWELEDSVTDVLLSDTVGFIDKLPHHLVASFHATLEEVRNADLLVHVVDASDPEVKDRVRVVREVLKKLGAAEIPELLVLNKRDLLDPVETTLIARELGADVLISAHRRHGLDALAAAVMERLPHRSRQLNLKVPLGDGATLAGLSREGTVHEREYEGEFCRLRVTLPNEVLHKYARFVDPPSED